MTQDTAATQAMTEGGDARLHLDAKTGLNRYHSGPRPSDVLAYASSTANDISPDAFAHVEAVLKELAPAGDFMPKAYAAHLRQLRRRIRKAYRVAHDVEIVFAPSGTDLEYVALAAVAGKAAGGTHNILLGADEVGSGCIHSAHGRYFADETALGISTKVGEGVPGLDDTHVDLIDIPVRDVQGHARPSSDITAAIEDAITAAQAADRYPLIHVVHGSKTGLILPALDDIDRLRAAHGDAVTFVVDACQARITSAAIADYLGRGAIVFITGSKFMGGPPFSGFALVPPALAAGAAALPRGLATIFRRAEWPEAWPGATPLPDAANLGLSLRLEASIFELERFQALSLEEVTRVVLAFHAAVRQAMIGPLPIRRVAPYPPGDRAEADSHPIEMRTLSTLDLSHLGEPATFEDAQHWHHDLLAHGIRLGQPVKCVKLDDGRWGATLRVGLSMPNVVARVGLSDRALKRAFEADMDRIELALAAVSGQQDAPSLAKAC
ncbi:hypothetical protein [Allosphingosinicella sp.]|uniref:hypothetical protein n=1 Tax=Allosphingosinicella sp. TaxID=2823234 RepID=UPI002FC1646F